MRLLKEVSGDRLTVIDQGQEFIGKRVNDQILWSDGAVWVRSPPVTTFDGHWAHKLHPEMVATIHDTRVQMADGFVTTLVPQGVDGFHITLNGEQHFAQRRGSFLYWGAGDVWMHVTTMRTAFDGRWAHKSNPEVVELVLRGLIHRPDGTIAKMNLQDADKCTVELSGQVLQAELAEGEIRWSDGETWLAARPPEPMNGKWGYNRNPNIVLEVCGDVVRKQDGSTVRILQQTESELFILHAGKRLQARLHNNELLWQDGAVWSRLEAPPQRQPEPPQPEPQKQPEDLMEGMEQAEKGVEEAAADGDCHDGVEAAEVTDLLGMQEANPSEQDFDPLKVGGIQPL